MYLEKLNEKVIAKVENLINSKITRITQFVIIVVVLALIMWDIYLYLDDQKEIISEVIRENAKGKMFVITWVWGILSAHLFVSKKKRKRNIPEHIAITILLLMSIIIFLLGRYIPNEIPQYMQVIFLLFRAITGYYLWPQTLSKQKNKDF
jgi:uncharacterized membrane protein YfcA